MRLEYLENRIWKNDVTCVLTTLLLSYNVFRA
jgi:hypothetical protein